MALTDVAIKKAKPGEKLIKMSDGKGLQLWIFTDGAKRWRFAYRFDGKQKTLALGVYPEVSLKEAREARDDARKVLASGLDPLEKRKHDKSAAEATRAATFSAIASELLEKKRREKKSDATLEQIEWCHEIANKDIGDRPISAIKAPEILALLEKVEARGRYATAKRLRTKIGEVFRYAISKGKADADPTVALKGSLADHKVKHFAAITDPEKFGGLLGAINEYQGAPETRIAMNLLCLTLVRTDVLRSAEWSQFDFKDKIWHVPEGNEKARRDHCVPLSPQALTLLEQLKPLTGDLRFLFPNGRTPHRKMSENAILAALRRMGFTKDEMTGHGFRTSALSMIVGSGLWDRKVPHKQLSHKSRDELDQIYDRWEYWEDRVQMMNWWADRCDDMRAGKPIDVRKTWKPGRAEGSSPEPAN